MKRLIKIGLTSILGIFGLISFCSAGSLTFSGHFSYTVGANSSYVFSTIPIIYGMSNDDSNPLNINCVFSNNSVNYMPSYIYIYYNNGSSLTYYKISGTPDIVNGFDISFTKGMPYYIMLNNRLGTQSQFSFDYLCVFSGYNIISVPTCSSQYTSEECQSEYSLVPEMDLYSCQSDLTSCNTDLTGCQSSLSGYSNTLNNCSNSLNSCTTNLGNCLQSNCGDLQWSALYINQIQHLSAPVINIDIPEEYNRTYTGDENSFELSVEGYNVDYEYIDNIITTQKTTPNSQDFNNIISGLIPLLIPGLVIILFLGFIFKFIKKIF